MQLSYGARTDVGAHRDLNEDAVLAAPPVFAVADGMGGHAAGEVASALAIDTMSSLAGRSDVRAADINEVIDLANQVIVDRARTQIGAAGMGTTLSGMCLGTVGGADHWFIFNVGDSRVYRLADGALSQITVDHSEVAELIAAGEITPEQALHHPMRNVVTRSLGTEPPPTADVIVLPVVPGERMLICSDGLSLELDDHVIASVMSGRVAAQAVADELVFAAVQAGGRDNVSAVVVDVDLTVAEQPIDVTTAPRSSLGGIA